MKRLLPSVSRLTLNLKSVCVLLVFLALVLALVVQQRRASARVRELRVALYEAHAIRAADECMRDLLGDRGIFILKTATRVEILSVGPGAGYPRTETGADLDEAAAAQLRQVLLDPDNYRYLDSDDMPDPQGGFRIRDGDVSLDILVSVEGSNPTSPHADIWVITTNQFGKPEHRGSKCLHSRALDDLFIASIRQNKSRESQPPLNW